MNTLQFFHFLNAQCKNQLKNIVMLEPLDEIAEVQDGSYYLYCGMLTSIITARTENENLIQGDEKNNVFINPHFLKNENLVISLFNFTSSLFEITKDKQDLPIAQFFYDLVDKSISSSLLDEVLKNSLIKSWKKYSGKNSNMFSSTNPILILANKLELEQQIKEISLGPEKKNKI